MTAHEQIATTPEQKTWRFSVDDFLLLERNGVFGDAARAELLDGEIWVLNAIHSRHAGVQAELQGRIWQALAASRSVLRTFIAPSVEMGGGSLPEPDLVIAEAHAEGFLPVTKLRLAIEISDTTLSVDLGRKIGVYAAAGIPEYWVADLNDRVVHQFWAPAGDRYAEHREVAFGAPLTAATLDNLTIASDSL